MRPRRATCGERCISIPPIPMATTSSALSIFCKETLKPRSSIGTAWASHELSEVRSQPTPQVNAALLDRAMAFAPASILRLPDLLTTEVRVRGLEIFPRYQFDLQARSDGKFDILFRNRERDGWGQGKLEKLFLLLRRPAVSEHYTRGLQLA